MKRLQQTFNRWIIISALSIVGGATRADAATSIVCRNVDDPACDTAGEDTLIGLIDVVADLLLYLVGAVAVIMIVVAGLMYVTSSGESDKTKKAKDIILFAVIGLAIAIFARAIASFVIGAL